MIFALFTAGCGDVEPSNTSYSSLLKKTQAMSPLNQNHQSHMDPPVEESQNRKYSQDKFEEHFMKNYKNMF